MATTSLVVDVPAAADTMWRAVTSPAGFRFVSRGLVRWPVVAHRTEAWQQGETVRGWMFFFQIVPVALHTLTFERLDAATREFRTSEHGGIIRSWHHSITVEPTGENTCRIHDTVTYSAGILTPFLALAVRTFYAIRRPRWVGLARYISGGGVL